MSRIHDALKRAEQERAASTGTHVEPAYAQPEVQNESMPARQVLADSRITSMSTVSPGVSGLIYEALLARCARTGLAVEANSWGGVYLAVHAGCRVETGPGLPVLNSLAARALAEHGATCVTLSLEADRVQLEEVTAHGPVPCALTVFGRPPLLVSRAQLDPSWLGRTFTDRRDLRLTPRLERGLWVFRPTDPFDLRGVGNPRVRVRHLVADLTAAPDPAHDWLAPPDPAHRALRFNYDRSLA